MPNLNAAVVFTIKISKENLIEKENYIKNIKTIFKI